MFCQHLLDGPHGQACLANDSPDPHFIVQDASKAQRSEEGDMDTSPAAIAKRVAVVVSVLVFAGVIMFLLALKFAFPELI